MLVKSWVWVQVEFSETMSLSSEELSSFSSYFDVLSKHEHAKFWGDCSKIITAFLRNNLMPDYIAMISGISRYFGISRKFSVFWSIPGFKRGMLCCFQHALSVLNLIKPWHTISLCLSQRWWTFSQQCSDPSRLINLHFMAETIPCFCVIQTEIECYIYDIEWFLNEMMHNLMCYRIMEFLRLFKTTYGHWQKKSP